MVGTATMAASTTIGVSIVVACLAIPTPVYIALVNTFPAVFAFFAGLFLLRGREHISSGSLDLTAARKTRRSIQSFMIGSQSLLLVSFIPLFLTLSTGIRSPDGHVVRLGSWAVPYIPLFVAPVVLSLLAHLVARWLFLPSPRLVRRYEPSA